MNALLTSLLQRRSLKPKFLQHPSPSEAELKLACQAALRAPDHGRLVPYRFIQIPENERSTLAQVYADAASNLGYPEEKIDKARSKALKGPGLLAFCVDCSDKRVPAYEKLLTAGAALDQFLLALQAQGYGAIVLSGGVMESNIVQSAFELGDGWKMLCTITVGTPVENPPTQNADSEDLPLLHWPIR